MTRQWPVTILLTGHLLWPALAQLPDTTLTGDWRFDEAKGDAIRDGSGFGNGGVLYGAQRVPGRRGQALAFNQPGSGVKVASSPGLNLADAISIEAWICPSEAGAESRVILAKNDEYALRIDKPSEGGRISFFVHVGSPAVTWEPRVSSPRPPAPGVWQHLAAVWDGTVIRLYLDGEPVASQPRTGKPNPNPYPVVIGNWEYPSCHGAQFGGLIDEVRVYTRALTPDEVKAHCRGTDLGAPAR